MALPSDVVYGQDNITVADLLPGYKAYAGYVNGGWPNMTALRARFGKTAVLFGVATRQDSFTADAEACDCEPGTFSTTLAGSEEAVLKFLNAWKSTGKATDKPLVYVMGSWAQDLVNYLAAYGWDRSRYYLWTAHYTGVHLCGPDSCGLVNIQADATQYMSTSNDYDAFRGYVVNKSESSASNAIQNGQQFSSGDSGPGVLHAAERLYNLGFLAKSSISSTDDAAVNAAVIKFQTARDLQIDGICGTDTWAVLAKPNPAPPAPQPVTYDAPQSLTIKAGHTSALLTWKAPVNIGKAAIEYEVYIYEGTPEHATLVKSYPRVLQPTSAPVLQVQDGSLVKGKSYVVHVFAGSGAQVNPHAYASKTFTTG